MADRTVEEAEAEVTALKDGMKVKAGGLKKMAFAGVTKAVGEREVEVIITTNQPDRDKDIVETSGIKLGSYNKNPVVLFQHNPSIPVARTVKLDLGLTKMVALAKFPKEGVNPESDKVYSLIKEEIINSASIGFIPKQYSPIDPEKPWAGQHFKEVELLEWSFVSIPSNSEALIIGRSLGHSIGKWYSWAEAEGLAFGQVTEIAEDGIKLIKWSLEGGVWKQSENVAAFSAEAAEIELAEFKGFEVPAEKKEISDCDLVEKARIAKDARLRAINALRLRII